MAVREKEREVAGVPMRSPLAEPPGELLTRGFFETKPERVGPRLLGKLLVHRLDADGQAGGPEDGSLLVGRIVEVEAYLGPHNDPPDPAAHTHRGPTPRNVVLFGLPGHAYVYSIYGRYFCLNVSCEIEGQAGCVLLRALDPLAGLDWMARNRGLSPEVLDSAKLGPQLTSGPSRLCQALGIVRVSHNGLDVTDAGSPLQMRDDGFRVEQALVTPRIGIKEAVDWPLRFAVPGHPCVSGPKNLKGRRVRVR